MSDIRHILFDDIEHEVRDIIAQKIAKEGIKSFGFIKGFVLNPVMKSLDQQLSNSHIMSICLMDTDTNEIRFFSAKSLIDEVMANREKVKTRCPVTSFSEFKEKKNGD